MDKSDNKRVGWSVRHFCANILIIHWQLVISSIKPSTCNIDIVGFSAPDDEGKESL